MRFFLFRSSLPPAMAQAPTNEELSHQVIQLGNQAYTLLHHTPQAQQHPLQSEVHQPPKLTMQSDVLPFLAAMASTPTTEELGHQVNQLGNLVNTLLHQFAGMQAAIQALQAQPQAAVPGGQAGAQCRVKSTSRPPPGLLPKFQ